MKDLSLNQTLTALGYTTCPAPKSLARQEGSKLILRDDDTVAFIGTARQVWEWLGARADIVVAGEGFWCKQTRPTTC